jgi:hypothetical protein
MHVRSTYFSYMVIYRVNKSKFRPVTGCEKPEGELKYSCTLPLNSGLDGGGWSTPRPGRLTPRKETCYSLYRRLGGPQGHSGRVQKIFSPPAFDPDTAACGSTDYAKTELMNNKYVINSVQESPF